MKTVKRRFEFPLRGFARTFIGVKQLEADEFAKQGVEYELEHHRTKF